MPFDVLADDSTGLPAIEPSATQWVMAVSPLAPPRADLCCASNCTKHLASAVEAYVEAGVSSATRRAYRADLDHFEAWGGRLPARSRLTSPTTLPC